MGDFGKLLEEQIPRLRRYARALTHHAPIADDLVQDCLVRAVAKQHLWRPGTDLRAWLFTAQPARQSCTEIEQQRRSRGGGAGCAIFAG